jgi:hypothetical protein
MPTHFFIPAHLLSHANDWSKKTKSPSMTETDNKVYPLGLPLSCLPLLAALVRTPISRLKDRPNPRYRIHKGMRRNQWGNHRIFWSEMQYVWRRIMMKVQSLFARRDGRFLIRHSQDTSALDSSLL